MIVNLTLEIIIAIAVFCIGAGIFVTRHRVLTRQKQQLAQRLSPWLKKTDAVEQPQTLIKGTAAEGIFDLLAPSRAKQHLSMLFGQAGLEGSVSTFLGVTAVLFLTPVSVASYFELDMLIASIAAIVLASIPFVFLLVKRAAFRRKFNQQLPDAIDLMVSVLRSGHSIPQAVKTISEEIPSPCGNEFKEILHRMNLGQPFSQALSYSCAKFQSHELDLIRRAVAIQAEVGGSLAELLDKTNSTLRQRLQLVQKVTVLTAQSRLTAIIVGLLPLVLAFALQFMSPGYLNPLVENPLGKTLLAVAVVLQITGLLVMKRMSTVKV